MNEWKIVITPEFEQDFINIYTYIAEVLLVPETAQKQINSILDQIEKLNKMPHRFPLIERDPWRDRGLRKLIVDNYIVFYLTNEKTNEVVILHVFYSGRNIDELLQR